MVLLVSLGIVVGACEAKGSGEARPLPNSDDTGSRTMEGPPGEPIVIPSDAKATYAILERGGTSQRPTLVTRRVGASGITYSRRIFDCGDRTVKYLGTGDSLREMDDSTPDPKMGRLVDGSIADVLWHHACD